MTMMSSRPTFGLLLATLLSGYVASAQPEPLLSRATADAVVLKNYEVKVDLNNQVARIKLELTFTNPSDVVREETYVFPVPKGTVISNLTLCGEGQCHEGKLMSAPEARNTYENIVRRTKDPALLEYLGDRAFQVRVFPIPPRGEQTIEVIYQQVLQRAGNLVEFVYPLTGQRPIERFFIQLDLRENEPVANIYSPSHRLSVERVNEQHARISAEARQLNKPDDFRLFYTVSDSELGVDLLTYKRAGEDGYFLLLISPAQAAAGAPLPKDFVFIVDISGSMEGEKLTQAKESLRHALGRLHPQDKLAVLAFSDTLQEFSPRLVPADGLDRQALNGFVDRLDAAGGTNIHDALLRGLSYFEADDRLKIMVFLTDGIPSSGLTDPAAIMNSVSQKNDPRRARIFVFGVGYDVNTMLLDSLSEQNGGFSTYVEPGESIEAEVARFHDKTGAPLLTDLQLAFGDLAAYDIFPTQLPDLFKGSQLQIVGRYRAAGKSEATITAQREGTAWSGRFSVDLPAEATEHSFLPRLWASRRIGHLLNTIRLQGENPELVDAVKKLAEQFGIVTPYTSYFAAPPEATQTGASPGRLLSFGDTSKQATGPAAVRMSGALQQMRLEGRELMESALQIARGLAFAQDEVGRWRARDYAQQSTIKIKFGEEAYFALAAAPDFQEYLALGSSVVFPWEGRWIEINQHEGAAQVAELPTELAQKVTTTPPHQDAAKPESTTSGSRLPWIAGVLGFMFVIGAALAYWMAKR